MINPSILGDAGAGASNHLALPDPNYRLEQTAFPLPPFFAVSSPADSSPFDCPLQVTEQSREPLVKELKSNLYCSTHYFLSERSLRDHIHLFLLADYSESASYLIYGGNLMNQMLLKLYC